MAAAAGATIATWFALDTIIRIAPVRPAIVQALPALIAVVVLVAFSAWLLSRLDQRRYLEFMSAKVFTALATGSTVALVLLGFTAVYRPGFEAVAFYQGLLAYTRGLEGWLVVGAAAGAVAVAGIALAMFRLGRRVPLTAFLGISVVIVMAISVAFLGNAVRSLQEGYIVGITNLTGSLPRLPIYLAQATGYHPTLETIVAQLVLVGGYVVAAAWAFALARRRSRRIPRLAEASTTP
jgi:high-affinity iron transporter